MNIYSWLQIVLYLVVLLAAGQAAGRVHGAVYQGERTFLDPVLRPGRAAASIAWRACSPTRRWTGRPMPSRCCCSTCLGLLVVYALQRLQGFLPLNPQGLGAVTPDSAFNTAVSFATNTNWQGYGGETTMSYLTQMLGLTVQNFVSAATGMAVLVALIRGLARHTAKTIGNFWVDLTRSTLYILLPLSLVLALVLVSQGVVQTFSPYQTVSLLQPTTDANGEAVTEQMLAVGPGRLADRHQAAGHQRRRLLQRQLGPSVREPDAALELPGDAGDPADPGGAVLHLRQDGGRHAPGLGDPGGDDRHLRGVPGAGRLGGTDAATRPSRPWASIRQPDRPQPGRQHGRQGSALRHRQLGPVGHRHHRRLQRLGQLHARLVHAAGRAGAAVS